MSEKTEEPTAKKLRDARRKGQVAHSKDLTQAILVLALLGYLIAFSGTIVSSMAQMIALPTTVLQMPFDRAADTLLGTLARAAALLLLPILGLVVLLGAFAETMQVGILFAFEAIKPSGKKLDLVANAKNMLGAKSWIELGKSTLKVSALGAVVTLALRDELSHLITMPRGGLEAVGASVASLLRSLFVQVAGIFALLALFDYVLQKRRYRKDLMMSKDEVKREYKEMEGDPHIKHKRRHLHQELLESNSAAAARKASVVVTNPTHLAIAMRYDDPERTPLPVVLAKGKGSTAFAMVRAAREAGVPVIQNIPLARALMANARPDSYIPVELIEPVAELLRAVAELNEGTL